VKRYEIEVPMALVNHLELPPDQRAHLRLTEQELDNLEATAELMTDLYTGRDHYNVARAAHHLLARIRRAREERSSEGETETSH